MYIAGVTGVALRHSMGTAQREFRLRVVIETIALPVVTAMAIGTGFAVTALVGIVLAMAADALTADAAKVSGIDMAATALRRLMFAGQHERGARVIETGCRFPALWRMARLASRAQRVLMTVVLAVATDAGLLRALEAVGIAMATAAFGVGVTTEQRIPGAAMIEPRALPVAVEMTLRTIVTQGATVAIILAMAADTLLDQPLFLVGLGMAGLALGFAVAATDHKSGASVVEFPDLPAVTAVALRTILAQPAIVGVVVTVTGLARARRITKLGVLCVAVVALMSQMFAEQHEIRIGVIEALAVKHDDAG